MDTAAATRQHDNANDRHIPPEDRVPVSQKIGYGLGSVLDMWGHWLYPNLMGQVFNIFLGVSANLIGTATLLIKLFDAAADPLFGWLSDNTRSRFGRRRPFILVGAVLAGIGLPLMMAVPQGWSEMQYFWFIIISNAIFIPIMSCFFMPYQSLGSELTPNYHERTSVMSYRGAIQKVPELALFFTAQFTTLAIWNDEITGKPNILKAAQVYTAGLGVIMIIVGVVMFFLLRERYYDKVVSRRQEHISIRETLWQTLKCKPFRIQLSMKLAYAMGTSMVSALGYYNTVYYVCKGDLNAAGKWNFFMGVAGMVFGFMGIPTFAYLARRLGKRHAMAIILTAAIGAFVATWWLYNPNHPWMQIFATGLIAFTGAGFWMLDGSITADVVDYDELETAKRREGAFASCGSWIMKVGVAVGAAASFYILAATGFDAKLGGDQTERTLTMIRVLLVVIPVVGLLLALLALSRFRLTQQALSDIRGQLEARRGKV